MSFKLQVVDSSSLVSVLFREEFSHPYISFFHLLVNGFCVASVRTFFRGILTILILVGGISGQGGIKMASASTPSVNEPAKDLILVHIVQLKPMIKAQISGRSGISDVAFASVYSEKPCLKKLI